MPSSRARGSLRTLSRVQLVLHVDADALRSGAETGQSVLAGGVRVSAETSRRLACDASRVVMTHDSSGRVLDVGRSRRTIPVAIRRALDERDRGCRFPGCTNRLTDAHHVLHWADGGATRLDNLLLLCRRHHRLVHEGGYRVMRTAAGGFAFKDPEGGLVPEAPASPVRVGVAPTGTCSAGARHCLGSTNHDEQGLSAPPYTPLDLDWAMRTMYRPPVRCDAEAVA